MSYQKNPLNPINRAEREGLFNTLCSDINRYNSLSSNDKLFVIALVKAKLKEKKELLAAIGKKKRKETEGRPKKLLSENDNSSPKHNTQKELARDLGWSTGKVAEAEVIQKESPGLWDDVKKGEKKEP